VTGAAGGGAPRYSLGASLLDAVLAETLDPAYAEAAAARAAAGPSSATDRTRRRWRARVLGALTMAAAGLLLAVTYAHSAATAQGRELVRARLVADIQQESTIHDGLTAQLEELRVEVSRTREQVLAASVVGQHALDDLASAEQGAAAVPVTGPGLLVTLANADPKADADPVGGTPEEEARGRVQDGDLQVVVNALWAAGAEAVSINGQRLGPTTAIRFAGEAVLVDFRPVTNPYEISAIGDPDNLQSNFLESPDVRDLAVISEIYDLRFDFVREDELTLPAASTPELRTAAPEGDEPDATEGDEPDATVPDPTPGG
jgi:uncharacterized protein YlxW (UPF0749 family)